MKHSATSRLLAGATSVALGAGAVALTGTAAHAATQPYFTYTNGWRVDLHERELADVNGDGNADIVGFGYQGTYLALGRDDRTFSTPVLVLEEYGYDQGWRVDRHPRELADVNGDGYADVVAFGTAGTYVSYGTPDGDFTAPSLEVRDFGTAQGWRTDEHLRVLGDVNGDGTADLVGFGNAGTYVSYGYLSPAFAGDAFTEPELKIDSFGANGGWDEDQYPRELADVNGDGLQDVVGFGYAGTYVSYGQENNTFTAPALEVEDFGWAQGWRVDRHPRELADVNGDGTADVVGFGNAGTYVAYGQPDETFTEANFWLEQFGYDQGWRVGVFPRELADVNGDGRAEVVGFGYSQTYIEML